MPAPLCFVALPTGRDDAGRPPGADRLMAELIAPAIATAGLEPWRPDGSLGARPVQEQLLLAPVALLDLTGGAAELVFALGTRLAARPGATVVLLAEGAPAPIAFEPPLLLRYALEPAGRAADDAAALARLLADCSDRGQPGSPLLALLDGVPGLEVASDKTDLFRQRVAYDPTQKAALAEARAAGAAAVAAFARTLGPPAGVEAGLVVDLLLSWRAVGDWPAMLTLIEAMPAPLAGTALVQEQRALALNRAGRGGEAAAILTGLVARRGPSSETLALLGRVHKDGWQRALEAGEAEAATAALARAVDAYRQGFEADWRDHYPGINAVTLMELQDPPAPERLTLLPVVRYAVLRRLAGPVADYWDWATMLELAVLARDEAGAEGALTAARAAIREPWEPATTASNLRLIRQARERRGEPLAWAGAIEAALRP